MTTATAAPHLLDHRFPAPFAATLAATYGWTDARAAAALREYLRFLALAAHGPAAPSRDIDLTHALHRSVHPGDWAALEHLLPPAHGACWGVNSADLYAATLDAYARTFGRRACPRVWPDARRSWTWQARQWAARTFTAPAGRTKRPKGVSPDA